MERRKILLGSGAALATVIAGCSSTETGEENPDDDDSGFDGGTDNDDGLDDANENDANENDDEEEEESIPGVDGDGLDVSTEHLSVRSIEHKDDTIDLVIHTDATDAEILHKELVLLAEELAAAITDPEAFVDAVSRIEWVVEHEGSRVLEVFVDVDWLIDYLDDEITREELKQKILATKE